MGVLVVRDLKSVLGAVVPVALLLAGLTACATTNEPSGLSEPASDGASAVAEPENRAPEGVAGMVRTKQRPDVEIKAPERCDPARSQEAKRRPPQPQVVVGVQRSLDEKGNLTTDDTQVYSAYTCP